MKKTTKILIVSGLILVILLAGLLLLNTINNKNHDLIEQDAILFMSTHKNWILNNETSGWNIWKYKNGKSYRITDGGFYSAPSLSPDRSYVAFTSYEDINTDIKDTYYQFYIWKIEVITKQCKRISPEYLTSQSPSWSPKGDKVVFSGSYYVEEPHKLTDPMYYDEKDNVRKKKKMHMQQTDQIKLSKIFQRLPDSMKYPSLFIMTPEGKILHKMKVKNKEILSARKPSWANDDNRVVFIGKSKNAVNLYVWSIKDDKVNMILSGEKYPFIDKPDWSPVEDKIAFVSQGNIHIINLTKKLIQKVTNDSCNREPSWTKNGRTLLYTKIDHLKNNTIWQYDLAQERERKYIAITGQNVFPVGH